MPIMVKAGEADLLIVEALMRVKARTEAAKRPAVRPWTPIYSPWPRQIEALRLLGLDPEQPVTEPVEELLYGGQAGGGKSFLLRAIGVAICQLWPGAVVPLFRRTYPELEDSHIRWIREEVPALKATYNQVRHELKFANGSSFLFRHANDDAAVLSYLTAEWAALLIDQAEQFSPYQLQMLRSRVRQPVTSFGGRWRPIHVLSANPGGLAHQYLRDGFVDANPADVPFIAPEDQGGLRRCYLPARLADNPSLNAADYQRVLRGLPEHLQRAYLDGDWSSVVGARFELWRASQHDAPWHVWPETFARERYDIPLTREPTDLEKRKGITEDVPCPFPPADWITWAAVDGGTRDPWVMEAGTRAPNGRIFIWSEDYIVGIEVPDQAKRLVDFAKHHRISKWVADPAMFANRANMSVSDAQIYAQHGIYLERGNNKREQGWRRISEMLSNTLDDGYPELVVIEGKAPQLVRTLPLLLSHPIKREDVDGDLHGRADPKSASSIRDDAADAARYLVTPAALEPQVTHVHLMNARYDSAIEPDTRRGEVEREYEPSMNQTGIVGVWK